MQFSNARFRLALYPRLAAIVTTLILMDINLVIAVMFRLLAARSWLSRRAKPCRFGSSRSILHAEPSHLRALVPVGNILLRHGHSNGRSLVRR